MQKHVTKTLSNGVRVVVVPMDHLHVTETAIYIEAGGRDEVPAKAGISHFLEHVLFRGCEEMNTSLEIEAAFEQIGGTVNASTDAEATCYYSRSHPSHSNEALRLFAAMLQKPLFNDVEVERAIISEEALDDYNEQGIDVCPDNLTSKLLWPNHPLGLPTIGTPDSVAAITRDDIIDYYHTFYRPELTVICVAGKIDVDAVMQAAENCWSSWKGNETLPPIRSVVREISDQKTIWAVDSTSQVNVQICFPSAGRLSADADVFRILRRILAWGGTSRLMLELREKDGLVYNVEAGATLFQDSGCFSIDLTISPEKLSIALKRLVTVLKDLANNEVSESELAAVKQLYCFDLDFTWDNPEAMIYRFGFGEQVGMLRSLEDEWLAIEAVTARSIKKVVGRCFHPENMKVAIVGPVEALDQSEIESILYRW